MDTCYDYPIEIVEKILSYADGQTLDRAAKVSRKWAYAVENLTKKTQIWKYCCLRDKPVDELLAILSTYYGDEDSAKWVSIYHKNFLQRPKLNELSVQNFPRDIAAKSTCAVLYKKYVLIGCDEGNISVYDENEKFLIAWQRVCQTPLQGLHCTHDINLHLNGHSQNTYIIAFSYRCLFIYLVDGEVNFKYITVIRDVLKYSIFKTFICCELPLSLLKVFRIDNRHGLQQITYCRNYTSTKIKFLNVWNDMVFAGTGSKMYTFSIAGEAGRTDVAKPELVSNLSFTAPCFAESPVLFYGKMLVCPAGCALFISPLENNSSVGRKPKQFDTMKYLRAIITAVHVHGNFLLIGTSTGYVYLYNISDWETFDLKRSEWKKQLSMTHITGFHVQECVNGTKILITSKSSISTVFFLN